MTCLHQIITTTPCLNHTVKITLLTQQFYIWSLK